MVSTKNPTSVGFFVCGMMCRFGELKELNMKRIVIIIFICLGNILLAQQGKYQRKSISSLGLYKVAGNTLIDSEREIPIEEQIKNPRFDYNSFSEQNLYEFKNNLGKSFVVERPKQKTQVNLLTGDPEKLFLVKVDQPIIIDFVAIGAILNNTILKKMLDILNDPELIKIRSKNYYDESANQTFAMTKAKSLGITVKEISQIMNTSYIYLAYIEKELDPKDDLYTVIGGILWWQLKIDKTGYARYINVMNEKVSATGFSGREKTSAEIRGNAYIAFAENIGKMTRTNDDFKLSDQIIERDGRDYSFSIGIESGVFLNRAFFVADISTDDEGYEKINRKGFALVTKPGVNNSYSIAKQIFGKKVSVGDLLIENPKNGVELYYDIGLVDGSTTIKNPAPFLIDGSEIEDFKVLSTKSRGFTWAVKTDLSPEFGKRNYWFYNAIKLSTMTDLMGHEIINYSGRVSYQYGLFKRYNIRRLYLSRGWLVGYTFSIIGGNINVSDETLDNLNSNATNPVDQDFKLWDLGLSVSPSLEIGFFLNANLRIYTRMGLQLFPFTYYSGSNIPKTSYSEEIKKTISGLGVQGFVVPSINIGISRTVDIVPRSLSFLNAAAGIKNKKRSFKITPWDIFLWGFGGGSL
jgi:hypothetical protein